VGFFGTGSALGGEDAVRSNDSLRRQPTNDDSALGLLRIGRALKIESGIR
jgi:hypothetical protein